MAKFDYGWALEHITEALSDDPAMPGLNQELREELIGRFRPDDSELALGYITVLERVVLYLHSILPIRTETTIAKTTNFDPSDTEIARFRQIGRAHV